MKYQKTIRVFMASPGDVVEEREAFKKVAEEFNTTWADFIGMRIDLLRWETHTRPSVGVDAQEVINQQIEDDFDILVGIMRARLGTPTGRAISGTVEEFERAYERHSVEGVPEVMFYFHSDSSAVPEIEEFKSVLEARGVYYWSYQELENFTQATRIHLSRKVQQLAKADQKTPVEHRLFPKLSATDIAEITELVRASSEKSLAAIARISSLYEEMSSMVTGMSDSMQRTARKLNRMASGGFRPKSPAIGSVLNNFRQDLDKFEAGLNGVRPKANKAFKTLSRSYSEVLSLIAPVYPLPGIVRPSVSSHRQRIGEMQKALVAARDGASGTREIIANWEVSARKKLNRSRRSVLRALDALDVEFTEELRLMRELGFTIEEFLES